MNENNKNCNACSMASSFDFNKLAIFLSENYKATTYKDLINIKKEDSEIFIFQYGSMVFWNCDIDFEKRLIEEIKPYSKDIYEESSREAFSYKENSERIKISEDSICLDGKEDLEKLAVSYAISQSVKLDIFEKTMENLIQKTENIPRNIYKTGKTKLNGNQISKIRGEIFLERASINLHYNLLDTPDFFWSHPELENYYSIIAKYLDIQYRIEILNKKLSVIHELFDMLSDEQKHNHSAFLEWIIIFLIMIEILFTIIEFIPKYFH